ncbi:MAG: selenocysteine-specific translation elongation factor [Chloroflexota bacterium]|nr:selenocysteine-specific translation elongation factor [Chloroflexota bacterium]
MTTSFQPPTTHYVVGTAGHVDHGKSLLVEALTGIDPDRLDEEKTRGMTIDLGFAWLTLPGGRSVSIVDVPGHERFIKNMLAGAGGIDLALLVVAADDGVMPQTREHLAILDLLDVQRGVVAITKRDLVDPDWLSLVTSDVRELLAGSTLEAAPIVACSSVTREGLDELLTTIEAAIEDMPPKRDVGRPRLPIDRVFTMVGFGTVVTGTLCDGELRVGEEVEAMPGGLRGRIRGLQSHGDRVERVMPGTRTAANISGIAKEDLCRGMVLARPETLRATTSIDVRLRAVEGIRRSVRHNLSVTFHSGADEANAHLRMLDADELRPGGSAWAQIKLDTPIAVLAGDRFVLRTANDTVAGGVIAVIDAKRHRRRDPGIAAALEALLAPSPAERVLNLVARRPLIAVSAIAAELALAVDAAEGAVRALEASGVATRLDGGRIVTAAYVTEITGRAHELLSSHHAQHPLRPGMPAEEFRSRLALDARAYAALMPLLPEVRLSSGTVALVDFSPAPATDQQAAIDAYLAALRAKPAHPDAASIAPDLLAYLISRGAVVDAGGGIVYEAATFAELAQRVREHIERHGTITLAQARDLFGTSRKYAQALLEHLDRTRVTRRVGDERVLR